MIFSERHFGAPLHGRAGQLRKINSVHRGIGQNITLGQVIRKADHGPVLLGIVEKFPPPGGDGGGLQIEDADNITVIQDIVPTQMQTAYSVAFSAFYAMQ